MAGNVFFDAHLHLVDLRHPAYLAFMENLSARPNEMLVNLILSPSYLMGSIGSRGMRRIKNLFSAVDRSIEKQIVLLEDDLKGKFGNKAFFQNGEMKVGGSGFDKIGLVPLVMDFSQKDLKCPDIVYDVPDNKPADNQLTDLLEGIDAYKTGNPDGIFDFFPFAAIHAAGHTAQSLEACLDRLFQGNIQDSREAITDFPFQGKSAETGEWPTNRKVYGIKIYPPLGNDPWPEDHKEKEKAELLYSYAQRHRIPLVTHCDDQGFRTISVDQALKIGSPDRWIPILKRFPGLKVDFAHFGKRYFRKIGESERMDWTQTIVKFMLEYENVFTDIAFNGVDPRYYKSLGGILSKLDSDDRQRVEGHILFGSDFPINLLLIDSYSAYIQRFESAPLDPDLKIRMVSSTPRAFLYT